MSEFDALCANDGDLAELRSQVRQFLVTDRATFGWQPEIDSWLTSWDAAFSERLADAGYVSIGLDHFARPDDGLATAQQAGRLRRNFQGYTDDQAEVLVGGDGPAVVLLSLSPSAQALLASITATQIGQPLAILIDGELRMAPIIREPISDGRLALTGFDSLAEANALVDDWSR